MRCTRCEHMCLPTAAFCEQCGYALSPPKPGTRQIAPVETTPLSPISGSSNAVYVRGLIFRIPHAKAQVDVPIMHDRVTLGRRSELMGEVDLDLSPFEGEERGVSRRHAQIIRKEGALYVIDLGSVNGTTVGAKHLVAGTEELLTDLAEIRLGQLSLTVVFR